MTLLWVLNLADGRHTLLHMAERAGQPFRAVRAVEEAFAPHDPRRIDKALSIEECAAVLAKLKPAFIHHPECKLLLPEIIRGIGGDAEQVHIDVPRLRSAYPTDYLTSGIACAFHGHRDTRYSAPFCQINWCMPVWEIEERNCLAFCPEYFDAAVENSSELYNYYEWSAKNRASGARHVKSDTREQPELTKPSEKRDLRLLAPPGGLIPFSAAHLHEAVPDTSGLARHSIDFRTVHKGDAAARRGEPRPALHRHHHARPPPRVGPGAPAGRDRGPVRRRDRDRGAQGGVRGRGGGRAVLNGALALVTGATGMIGRAIGLALREAGAEVVLHGGRDPGRAAALARETGAETIAGDLTRPEAVDAARARVARSGRLDVLTLGSGIYDRSEDPAVLERMLAANVLGPYALLRALLPFLVAARGQVVFLNSTQGLAASRGVGQYAATQHAMRAVADSLREEVNEQGVRVLSLFLGRTAGNLQRAIFAMEGRPYAPERLIQPGDVAEAVLAMLRLPRTVEATQLVLRPMQKT